MCMICDHCSLSCSAAIFLFTCLAASFELQESKENDRTLLRNSYIPHGFPTHFLSGRSKFSRDHTVGYKGRFQHYPRCKFCLNLFVVAKLNI